jgi:uroporphyrinogen III methyltransferase/synthase
VAAVDLAWFERRPLFGRRIVVTRTRQQASALSRALRDVGADPIEVPVIEIADPADGGAALRHAVARLATYDWIVVTSPNGAARLGRALDAAHLDARAFGAARVAAIGPATAAALRPLGVRADLVPERFVAEALLDALTDAAGPGRLLLARAEVARDVLPDGLRARGWEVDVVDAYRTVPATVTDRQRAGVADAEVVTFTSSSTVDRFVDAVGIDAVPAVVACIGPVTAQTARDHGLSVDVVAEVHTVPGLVDALVRWAAP